MEGGRGGGRHARAGLARERRGPGASTTSTRPTRSRSTARSPTPTADDYDGARAAGRRRQPGLPAHRRGRRRASCAAFFEQGKPVGGDLPRAVDAGRGRRRARAARSPRGRRCRPTSATRAATGSTRRSTSTRASSPRATPTTCRRSAPSSSRSSPRASTRASARASAPDRVSPGRDPGHRRHARRHELPARDRLVPGVPRARGGAAAVAHPPPHRHGRRPAGRRPRRRGVRRRARRRRARRREGPLHGADRARCEPLDGRARRCSSDLHERGHAIVLASSAKPDEVDHYLDLLDARELADGWTTSGDVEQHQARARPRGRGASRRPAAGDAVHGRRLDLGLRGRQARRRADDRRADGRLQRARAARRRRRVRVPELLDELADTRSTRHRSPRLRQQSDGQFGAVAVLGRTGAIAPVAAIVRLSTGPSGSQTIQSDRKATETVESRPRHAQQPRRVRQRDAPEPTARRAPRRTAGC